MMSNLYNIRAEVPVTIIMLDSNEARKRWRETLDMVATRETDVLITRYNKPVAILVAYDDYLAIEESLRERRAERQRRRAMESESLMTMLASERVLARDWNTPEEDDAWANL